MTSDQVIETTLLRGRVRLLQPKKGFHASMDTVFLAASVAAKDRYKLLDIGCGVGSAGLCVLARNRNLSLTGIDIQQDLADLAGQNAALNGFEDRCRFFAGNILSDKNVPDNAFNVVMMNPPYQEGGTHTPSPSKIKSIAHGEEAGGATLADWVKYAHKKLKQGGHVYIVHRADRLDDLVLALTQKRWFGSLVVQPLLPRAGEDAKRVIVAARKERYAPLVLKAGLVLHEKDGSYTEAAKAVLEKASAIDLHG
jgi:tRNA1(Val) A37 N6-methylase TrmN6